MNISLLRKKLYIGITHVVMVAASLLVALIMCVVPALSAVSAHAQTEKVLLQKGHADFGPTLSDGAWSFKIRDDTGQSPVWRNPDDVVLEVAESAAITMPDDDNYKFIGAQPGDKLYVIPQTQNPDVIWLGWNTQEEGVIDELVDGATLSLEKVQGPGSLHVYLENGNLQAPEQLWSSTISGEQKTWIESNAHTHVNWVFSHKGIYHVTLTFSGKLKNGQTVSDTQTLNFAVGSGVDARDALSWGEDEAANHDVRKEKLDRSLSRTTHEAKAKNATVQDAHESSSSFFLILVIVCAAVITIAAVTAGIIVVHASHKAKSEALSEFQHDGDAAKERNE